MLDSIKEAINDLCIENRVGKAEIQENPSKSVSTVANKFNVVVSTEGRSDLVKMGWSHRGVVGGNIYYVLGGKESSAPVQESSPPVKEDKPKARVIKKSRGRKK